MPIDPLTANVGRPVVFEQDRRLLEALEYRYYGAVETALAQNAMLPAKDEDGWTPLMWAAVCGDTPTFELLVSRFDPEGTTVNERNNDRATALMIAADERDGPAMVRLLELGADPNALHPCGSTSLLLFLEVAREEAHVNVIDAFVRAGADLDDTQANGRNALMFAAEKFSLATLTYVAQNASPHRINDLDEDGCSALFYAAEEGLEKVQFLVAHGALADLTAADGSTPAQRARDIGSIPVADFLQQTADRERQAQATFRGNALGA